MSYIVPVTRLEVFSALKSIGQIGGAYGAETLKIWEFQGLKILHIATHGLSWKDFQLNLQDRPQSGITIAQNHPTITITIRGGAKTQKCYFWIGYLAAPILQGLLIPKT